MVAADDRLGRVDSGDVRAFFERVSAQWDDMRSSFYNTDVIDALAEHGRVTAKSRVADVGRSTSHTGRAHLALHPGGAAQAGMIAVHSICRHGALAQLGQSGTALGCTSPFRSAA